MDHQLVPVGLTLRELRPRRLQPLTQGERKQLPVGGVLLKTIPLLPRLREGGQGSFQVVTTQTAAFMDAVLVDFIKLLLCWREEGEEVRGHGFPHCVLTSSQNK